MKASPSFPQKVEPGALNSTEFGAFGVPLSASPWINPQLIRKIDRAFFLVGICLPKSAESAEVELRRRGRRKWAIGLNQQQVFKQSVRIRNAKPKDLNHQLIRRLLAFSHPSLSLRLLDRRD